MRTTTVDGGLNPRIFGGGAKIGTNFAVDFSAAKRWERRKPPEAVAEGQRLQRSIVPPKSSGEIVLVALGTLL